MLGAFEIYINLISVKHMHIDRSMYAHLILIDRQNNYCLKSNYEIYQTYLAVISVYYLWPM